MNRRLLVCLVVLLLSVIAFTQNSTPTVPRLIQFGGTVKSSDGTPRTGVVGVMFSLYTEQQGGSALWTELQNVTLDANGQYTVLLGSQHAEGVPAELFTSNEARWLGIQVEAEAEQPRVLLVSVPYALKAHEAETLGGRSVGDFVLAPTASGSTSTSGGATASSSSNVVPYSVNTSASGGTANRLAKWIDATTLGDANVSEVNGYVGIGLSGATPFSPLQVRDFFTNSYALSIQQQRNTNEGDYVGLMFSGLDNAALGGIRVVRRDSTGTFDMVFSGTQFGFGAVDAMILKGNGFVGIGTQTPSARLQVADAVPNSYPLAVQFQRNSVDGDFVGLKFAASDNVPLAAIRGVRNDTSAGFDLNFQATPFGGNITDVLTVKSNGRVGIGTNNPAQKLSVAGTIESTSGGFKFPDASSQATAGVTVVNASNGISRTLTNGTLTLTGDTTYLQRRISGTCSSGTALGAVNADGTVTCNTVSGGGGSLTLPFAGSASSPAPTPNFAVTTTAVGPGAPQSDPAPSFIDTVPVAIGGVAAGTGVTAAIAGKATGADSIGVFSTSAGANVPSFISWNTASSGGTAGSFISQGSDGTGLEINVKGAGNATGLDVNVASASGIALNVNVPGSSTATLIQGAGFRIDGTGKIFANGAVLNGNVNVNGTLTKSSGTFKIDHPLDPANKFLYHSFVESPDMMNVYNGVIVLDGRGQAWVQLPDYFEALNQDFRYQLTAIGAPGPNLYISKEIAGNRFRIAGGKPHAKVSWQVTGIRHDAYADAHRIQVEVDKGKERGTYLHPELFGSRGVEAGTTMDTKAPAAPPSGLNK